MCTQETLGGGSSSITLLFAKPWKPRFEDLKRTNQKELALTIGEKTNKEIYWFDFWNVEQEGGILTIQQVLDLLRQILEIAKKSRLQVVVLLGEVPDEVYTKKMLDLLMLGQHWGTQGLACVIKRRHPSEIGSGKLVLIDLVTDHVSPGKQINQKLEELLNGKSQR